MAIHHVQVTSFSRKQGASAVHRAAYRSGEKLHDDAKNETYDYSRKGNVESAELILPDERSKDMPENRQDFWNWVEAQEKRKDSTTCKEIRLSLPHELEPEARLELARNFTKELVKEYGFGADLSRHNNPENDHVHILINTRRFRDGKLEKIKELDVYTGGNETVEKLRQQWAEAVNRELERRGRERIYASKRAKAKAQATERLVALERIEKLLIKVKSNIEARALQVKAHLVKVVDEQSRVRTFFKQKQEDKKEIIINPEIKKSSELELKKESSKAVMNSVEERRKQIISKSFKTESEIKKELSDSVSDSIQRRRDEIKNRFESQNKTVEQTTKTLKPEIQKQIKPEQEPQQQFKPKM